MPKYVCPMRNVERSFVDFTFRCGKLELSPDLFCHCWLLADPAPERQSVWCLILKFFSCGKSCSMLQIKAQSQANRACNYATMLDVLIG